jgi:hypothetical protein
MPSSLRSSLQVFALLTFDCAISLAFSATSSERTPEFETTFRIWARRRVVLGESSRWQLEASVPETVFTRYVAAATAAHEDITTQGLLRLQKSLAGRAGKASRLSNAALLTLSNGKASRQKGPRKSTK